MGIILYVLCTRHIPYKNPTAIDFYPFLNMLHNIKNVEHVEYYEVLNAKIGDAGINLLQGMLATSTFAERIPLCNLLKHEFFTP